MCIYVNLTQLETIAVISIATNPNNLQINSNLLDCRDVVAQITRHFPLAFIYKVHIKTHSIREEILLMRELKSIIKQFILCLHVNQCRRLLVWVVKLSFTLLLNFTSVIGTPNRLADWDLSQALILTQLKKKKYFYKQKKIIVLSNR